jgi:hypothetical protein
MAKNVTQKSLDKLLAFFSVIIAVVLIGAGCFAYWGYSFATNTVHNQLAQEKIKFPPAGSAGLSAKEFPGLQQYGGQAVDNGIKAKAYADEFIWVHMMKSSGGKTYAEVSEEAMANRADQKLAALKTTLFQGDMLRSSLLTAYAFSVFGTVAWCAVLAAFAGAALFTLIALGMFTKASRS